MTLDAISSLGDMADAALKDMILMDRDKLLYPTWVGVDRLHPHGEAATATEINLPYDAKVPGTDYYDYDTKNGMQGITFGQGPEGRGTSASVAEDGLAPALVSEQPLFGTTAWAPGGDAGVGYDKFRTMLAPTQGWKYAPFKMFLKFRLVRKRTYYNCSSILQTVSHHIMTRRRRQLFTTGLGYADANVGVSQTQSGFETLDLLPYGHAGRRDYNEGINTVGVNYIRNRCAVVHYIASLSSTEPKPETAFFDVAKAGEAYKHYAMLNEQPMSGRWLRSIYQRPPVLWGNLNYMPTQMNLNTFYGGTPDMSDSLQYTMALHENKPFASATVGTFFGDEAVAGNSAVYNTNPFTVTTSAADYTRAVKWTPLSNPFLRRLFRIRSKTAVIAPGSCKSFVHRSRSRRRGVNLWSSGLVRSTNFFAGPDVKNFGSNVEPKYLEWMAAVQPYGNPYHSHWMPPRPVYATARSDGYSTSDLLVTAHGQMGFEATASLPPVTSTGLNFMAADLMYREHNVVQFKVCSYARPVTGGRTWYRDDMDPVTNTQLYGVMYPTAPPEATRPSTT